MTIKVNKKLVSGLLVFLLLACYLFATDVMAQSALHTSNPANITYKPDSLSYGDVWEFDVDTYNMTYYSEATKEGFEWYNGRAESAPEKKTEVTRVFATIDTSSGLLVSSVPMKFVPYPALRSNVELDSVASVLEIPNVPSIPVMQVKGDAATGVYSVVPHSTGDYYIYAHAATGQPEVSYARLDSCDATNNFGDDSYIAITEWETVGNNWYRGKVSVDYVNWYAQKVTGIVTAFDVNGDHTGKGTYNGGQHTNDTTLGGGSSKSYYYNNWVIEAAQYDTVLSLKFNAGTALGPITKSGTISISNDATKGSLKAYSIFGEELTVDGSEITLDHMPIILVTEGMNGGACQKFTNASGGDIDVVAIDGANGWTFYHEDNSSVLPVWGEGSALPTIQISNDSRTYNFVNATSATTNFTQGTKNEYIFTVNYDGADDVKSVYYSVSGDIVEGATMSGTLTSDQNYFKVVAAFEQTVVSITATDVNDETYSFTYTISPIRRTTPVAQIVGGASYAYVEDALMNASSGDTILIIDDASFVPAVTGVKSSVWSKNDVGYTVKDGVTLVVPFNTDGTVIKSDMGKNSGNSLRPKYNNLLDSSASPTEFRRLTIPNGIKLTVASGGDLEVGSKTYKLMTGQAGPYGLIMMEGTSEIIINQGADLYAWGYIKGSGKVSAHGNVYEHLSVLDYPGSVSSAGNLYQDNKIFPMRNFSIKNVEVNMKLHSTAMEYVFYSVWGSTAGYTCGNAALIGGSGGTLFTLQSGSTLEKTCINGRQMFTLDGSCGLNSLSINPGVEINTSDTTGLILPSNFDVIIKYGTMTMGDNVIFTEGSTLTINEGAALRTNGKNLYILDATEDAGTYPTSYAIAKDAKVDVNGTLISEAGFYTSKSGASIVSSLGTGKVNITASPEEKNIKFKGGTAAASVGSADFTSAKLQHADGTYLQTYADTYTYDKTSGRWVCTNHAFNDGNETQASTCTTTGVRTFTCQACGYAKTETIPASGHTPNADDGDCTTPITCKVCNAVTTAGKAQHTPEADDNDCTTALKCAECGTVITPAANAHTPEEDDNDCTTELKCSVCQKVITEAARDHELGAWQHATNENQHWQECTNEGCVHKTTPEACVDGDDSNHSCDTCQKPNVSGHNYQTEVTAPTCEAQGYTTYTCACGDTYKVDGDPALGHDYTSSETTPATCLVAGVRTYSCTCGDSYTEVIPKLDHEYGSDYKCTNGCNQYKQATVTWKNWDGSVLKEETVNCGTTAAYTGTTPSKAGDAQYTHTFNGWSPALGTVTGDVTYTAQFTSAVNEYTITWKDEDGTELGTTTVAYGETPTHADPTKAANGCTSYTFTGWSPAPVAVTGEATYTATYTDTTSHSYESVVTAPTCTAAGYTTYTCSVCGDSYVADEVAATGHNNTSVINAKENTHTEDGYTGDTYCADCQTVIEYGSTIEAAGHTYETVVTAPTCTEAGYTTYTCSCGDSYVDDEVAALGHSWVDATCTEAKTCSVCGESEGEAAGHKYETEVTAPDCVNGGYTTYTCSVCGDSYVDDEVAALGHSWVDATCTEAKTCSVCGEIEGEALGHRWNEATCVDPKTCSVCGATEGTPTGEHNYVNGVCKDCGDQEVLIPAYGWGQTTQIWLREPWALRVNLNVYHVDENGNKLSNKRYTNDELAALTDYGVYFVRESDLNMGDVGQNDLTIEDIINHPEVVHYTNADGKVHVDTSINALSVDFTEGIYTYQFSDSIFVLYYVENDGVPHYAPIRERNMSKLVNDGITDTTTYSATERAIFAEMAQLEKDIVARRGTSESTLGIMDAPTLKESPLNGTLKDYQTSMNDGSKFSHTTAVVLIEPWGLELNGLVKLSKSYDDYGVVVYYNPDQPLTKTPTPEELFAMENAYVFSQKNGDVTVSPYGDGRTKITALFNSGLYTFQMAEKLYVAYYVQDGDNIYYGPVKERSIKTSIETRLPYCNEADPDERLEKIILNDMLRLYEVTCAHRNS